MSDGGNPTGISKGGAVGPPYSIDSWRIGMQTEELLEMPFLRNIGIVMTYRCQVSCAHCVIRAGPLRSEKIEIDEALEWVSQIAKYRNGFVKVLSLTGGEPFYSLDDIKTISDFAEAEGLLVSAVTNAFWATTFENAMQVLNQLPAIKMISISTDAYHLASIPFEKPKNAILAARELGIPYTVSVCTCNEQDLQYQELLKKLNEITPPDTIMTAVTFAAGRALEMADLTQYELTDKVPISACSAGSSPIVFPDGRIIACIGPVIDLESSYPLMLGNLRKESLEDILEGAEKNPILHAIRIWGPKRLIDLARKAGLGQHIPERFVKDSICNACYSLMSNPAIVEYLKELAQSDFAIRAAYARGYYLNEIRTIELLGLEG